MIETELIKTGDVQFNTILSCILIIQNGIKDEACVPFQFLNLKKKCFLFLVQLPLLHTCLQKQADFLFFTSCSTKKTKHSQSVCPLAGLALIFVGAEINKCRSSV